MANDLKVKITADVKGFKSDIQDAGKSMDQFNDKTNEAGSSIADYQSKLSKSQMNIKSFNKELRQARKDALELGQAFRSLSPDQQMSGFGKQLRQQMDEAIQKAGELTDLKGDIQREIQNIASDTRGFDTAKESISVLMNTMGSLASVYATVTGDQEAYNRAVTIFTGTQQTLNALTAIQNALQKESNLYKLAEAAQLKIINGLRAMSISNIRAQVTALLAEATAQGAGATATLSHAAAQKALNAAMKAGPYIVIATAIAAIGLAIKGVTSLIDRHKKKLQEQVEAYKKATAAQRAYDEAMISGHTSIAKEVTRLQLLQKVMRDTNRSYTDRKAAVEEMNRVIPGYHASITKEGQLYENNQKAIINYINNLDAAAKAMAAFNALVKENEKLFDLQGQQLRKQGQSRAAYNRLISSGLNPLKQEIKGAWVYDRDTGKVARDAAGQYIKATKQQVEDFNKWMSHNNAFKNYGNDIKEQTKQVRRMSDQIAKEINVSSLITNTNTGGGNKTTTPKKDDTIEYEKLQTEDLIKVREKLNDKVKEYVALKNYVKVDEYDKEIKKIEEVIQHRKDLELKYQPKIDIKTVVGKIKPVIIPVTFDTKITGAENISKLFNIKQLQTELNQARKEFDDLDFVTPETLRENADRIDKLRAKIKELYDSLPDEVKAKIKIDTDVSGAEQAVEIADDLDKRMRSFAESLSGMGGSYISDFMQLGELLKNTKTETDRMVGAFSALSLIGDSIQGIGEGLAQLGTGSEIAKMGAIAAALGQVALGFAFASREAGKMGPYAWLAWTGAGLAALGTMISTIKQIQGYEFGGTIPGNSWHGDRILARVNSGERVLTKKQNDRLNNLLDNGGLSGGRQVVVLDTRIDGTDIWLTQRNVGKSRQIAGKKH